MIKKFFLSIALLLLTLPAAAAEKEPDAKELIKILIANGSVPLSADESCNGVGSSPEDKTIADYLASLISFQAEPDSSARVEVKNVKDGKAKATVWTSDLMFLGKSGEDIYSWGFRIQIKDADRKLVSGSIRCIGAG